MSEQESGTSTHDKEIARKIRVFIQETYAPEGDYNESEFIIGKINEMEIEAIQRNVEIDRLTKENDDLSGCLVIANENIVDRNAIIEQLKAENNKDTKAMLDEFSRANKAETDRNRLREALTNCQTYFDMSGCDRQLYESVKEALKK